MGSDNERALRDNGSRRLVVRVAPDGTSWGAVLGEGGFEADNTKVRRRIVLDLLLVAHVLGSQAAHHFTEVRHATEKELKEDRRDKQSSGEKLDLLCM
jgi:hypothetical protein